MTPLTVLAVGATGSIGSHVVAEALSAGHTVRALVRSRARGASLPGGVELVEGDVTRPETLAAATAGIDAVVFTLGSDGQGESGARAIDYGGVRNVLGALAGRPVRVALMTAIGITYREGAYNQATHVVDWKRRSERLVRASGHEYTIVRPGWFDYNARDEHQLKLLQEARHYVGDARDGVVARQQIAQVLVDSLTSEAALHKTFELIAEKGPAPHDLEPLFAALRADVPGALDGVADPDNMPLAAEAPAVRDDLTAITPR